MSKPALFRLAGALLTATVLGLAHTSALAQITGPGSIAAGRQHSCALTGSGGVRCWGRNEAGQLGDGTLTDRDAPVAVPGIMGATAVVVGRSHSCALMGDGTARCWGSNSQGQLGDGSTTDRLSPVAVAGLAGAAQLTAVSDFMCARLTDGSAKCWGRNNLGQLGDGTTTQRLSPVAVSGLAGVQSISVGNNHTCAVLNDGSARCWGWNGDGQLGDGTNTQRITPAMVPGIAGAVEIASGEGYTCVVLGSGAGRCWGWNGYGQLGDNTTVARWSPVAVVGLSGALSITTNLEHTCARINDASVRCWGNNGNGRLGDGTTTHRFTPTAVAGLTSATAVSAGGTHTCAMLADGAVRCWGADDYGQIGDGADTTVATQVAAGGYHTCAAVNDGSGRCWGRNSEGQLGNGTTIGGPSAVVVSGLVGPSQLALGFSHSCALLSDGTARCWGFNGNGQLGDGTTTQRSTAVAVSGLSGVSSLALGEAHSCARMSDGSARCWGANGGGQLGDGTMFNRSTPVPVGGLGGATMLAAGALHTCARLADATVKCWGQNYFGQLGNGTTLSSPSPVTVSGLSNVVQIAAGGYHTCALLGDGTVRCWGRNADGALGDGSTTDRWAPVAVSGLSNVEELAMGSFHSCARLSSGIANCWGYNNRSQLGDGTTTSRNLPVTVTGVGDIAAIAAGGYHTCMLGNDGTLYCRGLNLDGQSSASGVFSTCFSPCAVVGSPFLATYTLTYTAGANGSISGTSPQTVNHGADGSAVTAVPDPGYHFVQWSDGSTANPRTDTNVTANLSVTAQFAINTYTLTYTADANGSITGTSPQTVNHGSDGSAVTAVPDTGYHFVQWSDGSTANPRTDTAVTANLSVTAQFAINQYTLTYAAGANGSISGTSPQTVNHGSDGTAVSAVADAGHHFVQWSDGSTANLRTDTNVTANISVTASFAINQYALSYAAGANGSISGTSPQTVNHGSDGTAVSAVADTGYHFVQWSDGSTTNPRTDTGVTANLSVTAQFAINTYTLTYTAGANGSITGTSPQTVNHGSDGSAVTAVPDTGYHFVQWSDGSTANPRTDTTVTANLSVTAQFAINQYTLTYTAGANGSITGTSPQTVNHGSDGSAVTAVPDTGYHFVQWSDGSTTNPRTDTAVTANLSVTAQFAINTYTLTYTAGANGSISGTSPQTVNHGSDGTPVSAVADTGYHFVQWSDGSTTNPRTDTGVTANLSVTAQFAINQYTLTYTAGANGSITGTSPQTVNHGSDGTAVTAVPDTGYHFLQWSDGSTANPRTDTAVTANLSVTAQFAISQFTVSFDSQGGSAVASITQDYGSTVTVPAAPTRTGYAFVHWNSAANGSGTAHAPASTFSMPAVDSTLYAQWNNTVPTLAVIGDVVLNEDGSATVLLNIGDAESLPANLSVAASSDQVALLPHPIVNSVANPAQRELVLTPVANGNGGPVTVQVTVTDEGGLMREASFQASIRPVNDAPTFTTSGDRSEPAGASGLRTVPGFIQSLSVGPADEAAQFMLGYSAIQVADPNGVVSTISVAVDGTLAYTLSGNGGSASFEIRGSDNGGSAYGGQPTSSPVAFSISVGSGVDLQISKSNGRTTFMPGESVLYDIYVANAGPNDATGARVQDSIPPELAGAVWTCTAILRASCPAASGEGSIDALVNLQSGGVLRYSVLATVAPTAIDRMLVNTATVTAPAGLAELAPEDNADTDSDRILIDGLFQDGFEDGANRISVPFVDPGR